MLVRTLPARSFAVQVTVVVPTGKIPLRGGAQTTRTFPSRVSMAEGSAYGTRTPAALVATAVMSSTSAMRGAERSAGRAGSCLGSTMPQ